MIFSEIYSLYYKAVSRILALSVEGKLTEKDLYAISRENAFPESTMTIVPALRNKEWPLLTDDLHTPLERAPRLPLSTLEKRWLKAVLSDPRVSLFAPEMKGLEETEPLFDLQDIVCFDHDLGTEKSGLDCARYLVNYCQSHNLDIPQYDIQSSNVVGKDNIRSLMDNWHRFFR